MLPYLNIHVLYYIQVFELMVFGSAVVEKWSQQAFRNYGKLHIFSRPFTWTFPLMWVSMRLNRSSLCSKQKRPDVLWSLCCQVLSHYRTSAPLKSYKTHQAINYKTHIQGQCMQPLEKKTRPKEQNKANNYCNIILIVLLSKLLDQLFVFFYENNEIILLFNSGTYTAYTAGSISRLAQHVQPTLALTRTKKRLLKILS